MTSWFTKPTAALYAAGVAGVQLVVAFVTHRGWIRSGRFGYFRAASAERAAAEQPSCGEVVTLEEAVALKPTYPSIDAAGAARAQPQPVRRGGAPRARHG